MIPDSEPNYTQQPALWLFTTPSLQAQAFLSSLHNETRSPTHLHNIYAQLHEEIPSGTLVLFDIAASNKRLNLFWQNTLSKQKTPINVLLLNMDDRHRGDVRHEWPFLSAIFHLSDSQTLAYDRIKEMINTRHAPLYRRPSYLYSHHRPLTEADNDTLTDRENQILDMICDGATNYDIARVLFISEHTVRTHVYNLFKKIKVKSRTQAASWANGK